MTCVAILLIWLHTAHPTASRPRPAGGWLARRATRPMGFALRSLDDLRVGRVEHSLGHARHDSRRVGCHRLGHRQSLSRCPDRPEHKADGLCKDRATQSNCSWQVGPPTAALRVRWAAASATFGRPPTTIDRMNDPTPGYLIEARMWRVHLLVHVGRSRPGRRSLARIRPLAAQHASEK